MADRLINEEQKDTVLTENDKGKGNKQMYISGISEVLVNKM